MIMQDVERLKVIQAVINGHFKPFCRINFRREEESV